MFCGIVEATGQLKKSRRQENSLQFIITPDDQCIMTDDLKIGDSIAVNGVCLTVTHLFEKDFQVDVVSETLALTTLGLLLEEDKVNLERALRLSDRIGGHLVQGHVDCCGEIISLDAVADDKTSLVAKIGYQAGFDKWLVRKGYVALDGMSLTLMDVTPEWFTVTFIPHTRNNTIVKYYHPGRKINIEFDVLGKYAEKLMRGYKN